MYSEKNYDMDMVRLEEDTFWGAHRFQEDDVKEKTKLFKNYFKDYLHTLKALVETDFKKLSDKELYDLLSTFYDIYLTRDDYLLMLSEQNNKHYTSIGDIYTTMVFEAIDTEGHGRSFESWKQSFQAVYEVALSEGFNLEYRPYTKNEIKKLVEDKTIILLSRTEVPYKGGSYEKEEFEALPTLELYINNNYSEILNIPDDILDKFPAFGKLLRSKFKKSKVLKDIRDVIYNLNIDLEDIFTKRIENPYCNEISKACKEWYEASREKIEYEGMQKKLETNKK